uniref:ribosomal protein S20 n=1 Tax=Chroothece richteriana TaxID=101928 RepID=UPI001FCCF8FC|nr:ribosomal protein S20 [Chroothece richteriana]UNJ14256.1 ribosomal protein S20 [Chroothece richteriana]
MPLKKSILKRIKVSKRNQNKNKIYKTIVKNVIKKFRLNTVTSSTVDVIELDAQLRIVYSKIDRAVQKGVLHPNTGARKKSRLAQALKKFLETR